MQEINHLANFIRATELVFSVQSDGILLAESFIRKLAYCDSFVLMLECPAN